MTRDHIVRMALKACIAKHGLYWTCQQEELEHFVAIVAATEREAMIKAGWRQCAEGQGTTQYCKLFEDAVKAERERAWGKGFDHALDLLARYKVKKSKARGKIK